MAEADDRMRELVADVAGAYFSNSHVNASEIPNVIQQIAASLAGIGGGSQSQGQSEEAAAPKRASSAQVRKSITPDALISFEDNRPYKTLRRHLSGRGLSPEQYRDKHGLPSDYPMVAPSYSEHRRAMAHKIGLGAKGRAAKTAAPTQPDPAPAKPARKRRVRTEAEAPSG